MKDIKPKLPCPCEHRNHNFPTMLHIPAGKSYTHICPACKKETVVHANVVN